MSLKDILDICSKLATASGVVTGVFLYFRNRKKERQAREYQTYNSLDDKHIDFLKLCLQYPELNIYYKTSDNNLSPNEQNRRKIAYEILIAIMERAYILYKDQSNKIKVEQWKGWEDYIYDWMENENFRKDWQNISWQYETNFVNYLNDISEKTSPPQEEKK